MNNTEAQAYLAEQLREIIASAYEEGKFVWRETWQEILETEWLAIAHEVEGKMTQEQWDLFENCMFRVYVPLASTISWRRFMSNATYTQRATAMKQAGIKL